ncbi:MAG: cob(I)yrinic acid a,c-diamide adenosyltransferase [Dehalococcoidales bacterium]|nr:cob(I)yrinic acid a,c-diamide adenosyltransferase [Dehalococcoidales bacterium]
MHVLGRGDSGYTDLLGGGRVPKHDERVEAVGTIDEATSALGMARAAAGAARVRELLADMQQDLYVVMAELATAPSLRDKLAERITAVDVDWLEAETRATQEQVELPKAFILPGASPASASLDFARAIVRRAERQVAKLVHEEVIDNKEVLRYLNRASSLLFVLARYEEASQGIPFSLARQRRRGSS